VRFVLADFNLVVAGRVYDGFPLLINDDGHAIQPAQTFLWDLLAKPGRITSKKSWEAYGRAIYDFFAFCLTNGHDWQKLATDGMPGAIQAWRDWSLGTLGLTRRTVNQRLRTVVRFYKWAVRKGHIERVPFDFVTVQTSRKPGFLAHVDATGGRVSSPDVLLREERKTIRFLTKEQIDLCHKILTNPTHQLMFELMVRTGLRQIECRTFPDVYFDWGCGAGRELTAENWGGCVSGEQHLYRS
jgi:site-specific recombinase XerD